jgi:hypothetical protein
MPSHFHRPGIAKEASGVRALRLAWGPAAPYPCSMGEGGELVDLPRIRMLLEHRRIRQT